MPQQPFRKLNSLPPLEEGQRELWRDAASPRCWSEAERLLIPPSLLPWMLLPLPHPPPPPPTSSPLEEEKKKSNSGFFPPPPQRQTQRKEGTLSQSIGFYKNPMATQKNREQLPRVVTRLKRPPAPQNSDSAIIPELQNEQVLMGGGEDRTGEERRGANYCSVIITAAAAAEDVVLT